MFVRDTKLDKVDLNLVYYNSNWCRVHISEHSQTGMQVKVNLEV